MLCGDAKLRKLKPGGNDVFANLCGDVYIDIRNTGDYPSGITFSIYVIRMCGDLRMLVPKGTQITSRRIVLCGNKDIHVPNQEVDTGVTFPPHVKINVLMLCGDIKIRCDEFDM
jgi:hypothetical protein